MRDDIPKPLLRDVGLWKASACATVNEGANPTILSRIRSSPSLLMIHGVCFQPLFTDEPGLWITISRDWVDVCKVAVASLASDPFPSARVLASVQLYSPVALNLPITINTFDDFESMPIRRRLDAQFHRHSKTPSHFRINHEGRSG